MMSKVLRHVAVVALVLAGLVPSAQAVIYVEVGDAGETLATAQDVTGVGALTGISGSTTPSSADLFRIFITGGGTFSATTFPNLFDTQLFLFNAAGTGVYANDDSIGLASTLPAGHPLTPLAAGNYFLGISGFNYDPVSAGGLIFPSSPFSGVFGPTAPGGGLPHSGWTGGGSGGSYTIALAGAEFVDGGGQPPVIPEPSSLLLVGLGLAAARFRRRQSLSLTVL